MRRANEYAFANACGTLCCQFRPQSGVPPSWLRPHEGEGTHSANFKGVRMPVNGRSECQRRGVRLPASLNAVNRAWGSVSVHERQKGCGKCGSGCQENRGYPIAWLASWVGVQAGGQTL